MGTFTFDISEGKTRDELAELYREKCRAIGRLTDRIEELEAALTSIRDLRPVELSPGLISSPEELVRDMQIIANRELEVKGTD